MHKPLQNALSQVVKILHTVFNEAILVCQLSDQQLIKALVIG